MWYLISLHSSPLFYKYDTEEFVEVTGIELTDQCELGGRQMKFYPPMIANSEQAVAVLTRHGVSGFSRKVDAKEHAKASGLTSFKYLNTKQNYPKF